MRGLYVKRRNGLVEACAGSTSVRRWPRIRWGGEKEGNSAELGGCLIGKVDT
jgi:hypothetical protein